MSRNKDLYDFCRWNETQYVKSILSKYNNLDVLYEDGSLFSFAISKGNVEICRALLKYFDEVQFPNKENNYDYQLSKNKLRDIIQEAIDMYNPSEEVLEILPKYEIFEGSERSSIPDYNEIRETFDLNEFKFTPIKKSHSTGDLNNSTFDNSKENLLTEDNLKKLSDNSSGKKLHFIEECLAHDGTYDVKEYHSDLAGNLHNADEI